MKQNKMSIDVLGKGIVGMKHTEDFVINEMAITFVVDGKVYSEKIIDVPESIPVNINKLNLLTEGGKKVCVRPFCQKDVNELKIAFHIDTKKEQQLREDCSAAL